MQAYKEPTRFYHNNQHIMDCLSVFSKVHHLAHQPAEIEIALWFHDAIYDSKKDDNEEKSAQWACEYLQSKGVKPMVVSRIDELIMASKHHQAKSLDEALLVDVDLSILGMPSLVFEHYDQAIRLEYAWVNDVDYQKGRLQVLQRFLQRDVIYQHLEMRQRYEKQVRENLREKINHFQSSK
ncbi:MAG: hypothetical protein Q9M28_11755 [Mariprofundaceae bacterium]|nr:hypothetical protein [Mariprofundaceae bacterium]